MSHLNHITCESAEYIDWVSRDLSNQDGGTAIETQQPTTICQRQSQIFYLLKPPRFFTLCATVEN